MCLIVSAPKGSMIPYDLLVDATERNNDGWGLMYHDGRKIVVEKSPRPDADAIYELTRNLQHETIVHLRMTTHGTNIPQNTHPFEVVPEKLYMMHNGVVHVDGANQAPDGSSRSDTRILVEDYIQPIVETKPGRIHNPGFVNMVQSIIGRESNRLVFLDDQGKVTYFNKRLGVEWKGLWCSNTYAWTLHTERSRYAAKSTAKSTAKSLARMPASHAWDGYRSSWMDDRTSLESGNDDFAWASGNRQAEAPNDLVGLDSGLEVPRWIGDLLDMQYDELCDEPVEGLAQALEYLRDNALGYPEL